MIVDRSMPMHLFALVPKLAADCEPELRALDRLLDDDVVFQRVKTELARRSPHSLTAGRHSTPVEVILHLLVGKQLDHWSDDQRER